MKKAVAVVLLIALGVVFGPGLVREGLAWRSGREAVHRVEWMLRAKANDDEQLALCQWARGKIVMPMADMEEALPHWEAFWRTGGFGDGRRWLVVEHRIVDGATVDVTLEREGERIVLRVKESERIERRWDD